MYQINSFSKAQFMGGHETNAVFSSLGRKEREGKEGEGKEGEGKERKKKSFIRVLENKRKERKGKKISFCVLEMEGKERKVVI